MTTPVRPGWKTSELWLAAAVVGAILESGILETGSTLDRALGLVAIVLTSLGYGYQRARVKSNHPTKLESSRNPEAGAVALLPALALTVLAVLGGAFAWSCAATRDQVRASAGHAVDCTADAIEAQATVLGPRVQASIDEHTGEDGVDWPAVGRDLAAMVAEAGVDAVGCAATRTVDDLFRRRGLVAVDVSGFEQVRRDVLEGRTFETGAVHK